MKLDALDLVYLGGLALAAGACGLLIDWAMIGLVAGAGLMFYAIFVAWVSGQPPEEE